MLHRARCRATLVTACLALLLFAAPASAEIGGKPRIIDGDTLAFGPVVVRLFGLDAPELNQTCLAGGKRWACGQEASFALALETAYQWVTCLEQGSDEYGRPWALCYLGGIGGPDLNRRVVLGGWAIADRRYSTRFVEEEDEARADRRGIWRGSFIMPWEWLRGRRLEDK